MRLGLRLTTNYRSDSTMQHGVTQTLTSVEQELTVSFSKRFVWGVPFVSIFVFGGMGAELDV